MLTPKRTQSFLSIDHRTVIPNVTLAHTVRISGERLLRDVKQLSLVLSRSFLDRQPFLDGIDLAAGDVGLHIPFTLSHTKP